MYIGDTDDGSGLHHMVFEVSDNAIDEALAGYCDRIDIRLNADGSVTVADNGRGIPTGIHSEEGVSAAELVMTQLHAGGKFNNSDENAYKVSRRPARRRRQRRQRSVRMAEAPHLARGPRARDGVPPWRAGVAPLAIVGPQGDRRGTEVTFLPSPGDVQDRRVRLRQARTPLPRTCVPQFGRPPVPDRRAPRRARHASSCYYEGGIAAFVAYLDKSKTSLIPAPVAIHGERDDIGIDVALEWNDSYYEQVLCFTNNIPQRDGGTHLAAFRAALTRTLNTYAEKSGALKKEKVALTGDDMREGLTAIISVKLPDPKFSSQTKDKLV